MSVCVVLYISLTGLNTSICERRCTAPWETVGEREYSLPSARGFDCERRLLTAWCEVTWATSSRLGAPRMSVIISS